MKIEENIRSFYIKSYKEHSAVYGPNTCIFLEVGSFYEMYDILDIESGLGSTSMSKAVELLNIQLSMPKNNELFAGFPNYTLHKYASVLTKNGWTVVVINQIKNIQDKVIERRVHQILSPGTHLEVASQDAFYVGSLYFKEIEGRAPKFSISIADISTGQSTSYAGQLEGKYTSWNFDTLMHFCQIHPLKELLVHWDGLAHTKPSDDFLKQYLGLHNTYMHIQQYNPLAKGIINNLLQSFFTIKSLLSVETFLQVKKDSIIEISLTGLLNFLKMHFPNIKQQLYVHECWDPAFSVYLGNNVLNQLNIVASKEQETILSYFQKTYTPMGKRAIVERILKPISDTKILGERIQDLETTFSLDDSTKSDIQRFLKQICDLPRVHHKFFQYTISAYDIISLDQSYKRALQIMQLLEGTRLGASKELYNSVQMYIDFFAKQFDLEKALATSKDSSFLSANVAPKTYNIELELSKIHNCSIEFLNKLNTWNNSTFTYDEKELQIFTIESTRKAILALQVRLQDTRKETWPEKNISVVLRKNGGHVVVPYLDDLHSKVLVGRVKLNEALKEELPPICNTLCDKYTDLWVQLEEYIVSLDLQFSIAHVCVQRGFKKPFYEDNTLNSGCKIIGLRHPLIDTQAHKTVYVPHDISLNSGNEPFGMLLYGMNASGKSSLMKAVGICVLLAQVGCYVPAEQLYLKPYKSIYTRILNQDNIWAGLSSFAVEMVELREILKKADKYSLVLGDELCSGTESVSATALVASGLIWLVEKEVSFIFATHLHGLNNLSQIKNLNKLKICHLKVHYDPIKDILIYDRNLASGPGNTYYGLEVAKAMDIPFEYLELAHQIRKEILETKETTSSYNKDCIVSSCEQCGCNIHHMLEVHHIESQKNADVHGFFKNGQHKNSYSNLIVVCAKCHDEYHAGNLQIGRLKDTSIGPQRIIETIKEKEDTSHIKIMIKSYLLKYPKLTLKRLAFELESKEDIKVSESYLRTLRVSLT
jgi:DNA mismatch repair protein MutS